jgi:hypothetical protein
VRRFGGCHRTVVGPVVLEAAKSDIIAIVVILLDSS